MENCILYDWVSVTSRIHSIDDFIRLLGLNKPGVSWQLVKGAHGYRDRLYFESISIHYNGRDDMGIWLEMSGQGCRAFETYGTGDYDALFTEVLSDPEEVHLTRLDIAFDDHTGILDIEQICEHTKGQLFVTRFKGWSSIFSSEGNSVQHGSRSSEVLIRIYDKAAERGYTNGVHWIRCELQLRRDRALEYVRLNGSVGENFCSVLLNYLRYVREDIFDTNKWRWGLQSYWADLVANAKPISLFKKPGVEYNLGNLECYIFKQAGASVKTWINIYGYDKFQERLEKEITFFSEKQLKLMQDYGRFKDGRMQE